MRALHVPPEQRPSLSSLSLSPVPVPRAAACVQYRICRCQAPARVCAQQRHLRVRANLRSPKGEARRSLCLRGQGRGIAPPPRRKSSAVLRPPHMRRRAVGWPISSSISPDRWQPSGYLHSPSTLAEPHLGSSRTRHAVHNRLHRRCAACRAADAATATPFFLMPPPTKSYAMESASPPQPARTHPSRALHSPLTSHPTHTHAE